MLIYRNVLKGRELDYRTALALGVFFFFSFHKTHGMSYKRAKYLQHDNYFIFLWRYGPKSDPRCLVFTPVITALNTRDTKLVCFYRRPTSNDRQSNFCL